MFGRLMKSQRVSTLEVFSTNITVEARVILNVCPLYVSGDVSLPGGEFPADGAMPHLVNFVHQFVNLGVNGGEQI